MKDLQAIYKECLQEVIDAGIKPQRIISIKVNQRLTGSFGVCCERNGEFRIEISQGLVLDDTPIEFTKNTIIHEILHTVKGCFNHGSEWKRKAEIMNKKYGYQISRLSGGEESAYWSGKNTKGEAKQKPKYKVVCTGKCGMAYYRKRWCNLTANPNRYRCGKCGGNLKTISLVDDIAIYGTNFGK